MGELKDYYTKQLAGDKSLPISQKIIKRLQNADTRFFANDNISKFLDDESRGLLIDEVTEKFEGVLRSLLIDIDNDPNSKGTARRLAKMYINEIMSGRYHDEPPVASFPNDGSHGTMPYHGMLVVRAELKSMCSHHHQPVTGTAYIGVIPGTRVIGLSKYIRIAQHCARRGTLQEELCGDIAKAISQATESKDVGVYIEAKHGCCENRGIGASNSMTQTAVLLGDFLNDASVKNEFYSNIKLQTSRYSCN
jgi:GTP cyclohydrolase IA